MLFSRSLVPRVCDSPERREELQKYITGIVTRKGQKLIAIYCMPDHTRMLLGLKPSIAPSDLIGDIKTGSTNHINEQKLIGCRFSWQEGFGAFSVSHSHLGRVADYIAIKRCIIAENRFTKNILNFWSDIASRSISVTFSSQSNKFRDIETCRSYGAFGHGRGCTINIALLAELFTLRMTNSDERLSRNANACTGCIFGVSFVILQKFCIASDDFPASLTVSRSLDGTPRI